MDQYRPPRIFTSPHLETIFPALFRRVKNVNFERERINTPDDDFLDLDWSVKGSDHLVIISHGLEGDSKRPYMLGMAKAVNQAGLDALAWNFRGCSDEMNRQIRFYHSGATDDLDLVIQHALRKKYRTISLVGFSLGGNLTLKYLGERPPLPQLGKAVAISVPLDLYSSCLKISRPSNLIYSRRFLRNLKSKILRKAAMMPGKFDLTPLKSIRTLLAFDDAYTAPIHGFKNARDYYRQCSALYFLDRVRTPTLIINAINDPFLSSECYPREQVKNNPTVTLTIPEYGGHVGFSLFNPKGVYWSEQQTVKFILPEE